MERQFEDIHGEEDIETEDVFEKQLLNKVKSKQADEDIIPYDPQGEADVRNNEMAKIYGDENWEKVLNAETNLQLNFNRFCDKELPITWPCLPLNL